MWHDITRRLKDRRRITVAAAVAVLAGLLGPFGTFATAGLMERILFWAGVVATSLPLAILCRVVVERHLAGRGFWVRTLAVALAFAALYAPVLHAVVHLRTGADHTLWMSLPEMTAAVFLVALLVNAIARALGLGERRPAPAAPSAAAADRAAPEPAAPTAATPDPAAPDAAVSSAAAPDPAAPDPIAAGPADPGAAGPAPDGAPPPRLLARLPEGLRGEILHVTVRDHYTVVRTDRGAAQILLRFGDALAELDHGEGARVHRSHWVARRAVAGVARDGDRVLLRLDDGSAVPVSRRSRAALDALGLG